MECQYCGKEFLIGSRITDTDFCCPRHRQRFHHGLTTVVRRIQDESSQRPTGQPGFQTQTAVFDCATECMSSAPIVPARLGSTSLPTFRLVAAGPEVLPLLQQESFVEAEKPQDENVIRIQQPDPVSRLERISSILSDLRDEIERRRRDTPDWFGQPGRAPVIQLKPAV